MLAQALEVAAATLGVYVVGVDVLAGLDSDAGQADLFAVLEHRLSGGNRSQGNLVAEWDWRLDVYLERWTSIGGQYDAHDGSRLEVEQRRGDIVDRLHQLH